MIKMVQALLVLWLMVFCNGDHYFKSHRWKIVERPSNSSSTCNINLNFTIQIFGGSRCSKTYACRSVSEYLCKQCARRVDTVEWNLIDKETMLLDSRFTINCYVSEEKVCGPFSVPWRDVDIMHKMHCHNNIWIEPSHSRKKRAGIGFRQSAPRLSQNEAKPPAPRPPPKARLPVAQSQPQVREPASKPRTEVRPPAAQPRPQARKPAPQSGSQHNQKESRFQHQSNLNSAARQSKEWPLVTPGQRKNPIITHRIWPPATRQITWKPTTRRIQSWVPFTKKVDTKAAYNVRNAYQYTHRMVTQKTLTTVRRMQGQIGALRTTQRNNFRKTMDKITVGKGRRNQVPDMGRTAPKQHKGYTNTKFKSANREMLNRAQQVSRTTPMAGNPRVKHPQHTITAPKGRRNRVPDMRRATTTKAIYQKRTAPEQRKGYTNTKFRSTNRGMLDRAQQVSRTTAGYSRGTHPQHRIPATKGRRSQVPEKREGTTKRVPYSKRTAPNWRRDYTTMTFRSANRGMLDRAQQVSRTTPMTRYSRRVYQQQAKTKKTMIRVTNMPNERGQVNKQSTLGVTRMKENRRREFTRRSQARAQVSARTTPMSSQNRVGSALPSQNDHHYSVKPAMGYTNKFSRDKKTSPYAKQFNELNAVLSTMSSIRKTSTQKPTIRRGFTRTTIRQSTSKAVPIDNSKKQRDVGSRRVNMPMVKTYNEERVTAKTSSLTKMSTRRSSSKSLSTRNTKQSKDAGKYNNDSRRLPMQLEKSSTEKRMATKVFTYIRTGNLQSPAPNKSLAEIRRVTTWNDIKRDTTITPVSAFRNRTAFKGCKKGSRCGEVSKFTPPTTKTAVGDTVRRNTIHHCDKGSKCGNMRNFTTPTTRSAISDTVKRSATRRCEKGSKCGQILNFTTPTTRSALSDAGVLPCQRKRKCKRRGCTTPSPCIFETTKPKPCRRPTTEPMPCSGKPDKNGRLSCDGRTTKSVPGPLVPGKPYDTKAPQLPDSKSKPIWRWNLTTVITTTTLKPPLAPPPPLHRLMTAPPIWSPIEPPPLQPPITYPPVALPMPGIDNKPPTELPSQGRFGVEPPIPPGVNTYAFLQPGPAPLPAPPNTIGFPTQGLEIPGHFVQSPVETESRVLPPEVASVYSGISGPKWTHKLNIQPQQPDSVAVPQEPQAPTSLSGPHTGKAELALQPAHRESQPFNPVMDERLTAYAQGVQPPPSLEQIMQPPETQSYQPAQASWPMQPGPESPSLLVSLVPTVGPMQPIPEAPFLPSATAPASRFIQPELAGSFLLRETVPASRPMQPGPEAPSLLVSPVLAVGHMQQIPEARSLPSATMPASRLMQPEPAGSFLLRETVPASRPMQPVPEAPSLLVSPVPAVGPMQPRPEAPSLPSATVPASRLLQPEPAGSFLLRETVPASRPMQPGPEAPSLLVSPVPAVGPMQPRPEAPSLQSTTVPASRLMQPEPAGSFLLRETVPAIRPMQPGPEAPSLPVATVPEVPRREPPVYQPSPAEVPPSKMVVPEPEPLSPEAPWLAINSASQPVPKADLPQWAQQSRQAPKVEGPMTTRRSIYSEEVSAPEQPPASEQMPAAPSFPERTSWPLEHPSTLQKQQPQRIPLDRHAIPAPLATQFLSADQVMPNDAESMPASPRESEPASSAEVPTEHVESASLSLYTVHAWPEQSEQVVREEVVTPSVNINDVPSKPEVEEFEAPPPKGRSMRFQSFTRALSAMRIQEYDKVAEKGQIPVVEEQVAESDLKVPEVGGRMPLSESNGATAIKKWYEEPQVKFRTVISKVLQPTMERISGSEDTMIKDSVPRAGHEQSEMISNAVNQEQVKIPTDARVTESSKSMAALVEQLGLPHLPIEKSILLEQSSESVVQKALTPKRSSEVSTGDLSQGYGPLSMPLEDNASFPEVRFLNHQGSEEDRFIGPNYIEVSSVVDSMNLSAHGNRDTRFRALGSHPVTTPLNVVYAGPPDYGTTPETIATGDAEAQAIPPSAAGFTTFPWLRITPDASEADGSLRTGTSLAEILFPPTTSNYEEPASGTIARMTIPRQLTPLYYEATQFGLQITKPSDAESAEMSSSSNNFSAIIPRQSGFKVYENSAGVEDIFSSIKYERGMNPDIYISQVEKRCETVQKMVIPTSETGMWNQDQTLPADLKLKQSQLQAEKQAMMCSLIGNIQRQKNICQNDYSKCTKVKETLPGNIQINVWIYQGDKSIKIGGGGKMEINVDSEINSSQKQQSPDLEQIIDQNPHHQQLLQKLEEIQQQQKQLQLRIDEQEKRRLLDSSNFDRKVDKLIDERKKSYRLKLVKGITDSRSRSPLILEAKSKLNILILMIKGLKKEMEIMIEKKLEYETKSKQNVIQIPDDLKSECESIIDYVSESHMEHQKMITELEIVIEHLNVSIIEIEIKHENQATGGLEIGQQTWATFVYYLQEASITVQFFNQNHHLIHVNAENRLKNVQTKSLVQNFYQFVYVNGKMGCEGCETTSTIQTV